MKWIMKKNQIVITVLAVMLAIAGYLTYSGKGKFSAQENETRQAIAEYENYTAQVIEEPESSENISLESTSAVFSETAEERAEETTDGRDEAYDSLDVDEEPQLAVLANGLTVKDFIAQSKLSREQNRGKNKEDLLAVVESDDQNGINKQAAMDAIVKLSDYSDRENAVETLLSAKGFDDSMAVITDDKVDVIICRDNLTDAEIAQIEDAVKRKAAVDASKITITLMGSGK